MKKILIIAYPPLDNDPRPNRQIKWLRNNFIVHTIGTKKNGLEHKFYKIKKQSFLRELFRVPFLILGLYNIFYWDKYKKQFLIKNELEDYDIVIVHEVRLLPFALKIVKNAKIILDAHEFSPENFSDNIFWRTIYRPYYKWLCDKYLKKCNTIITVSSGIADLYYKTFGVKPEVVTNACEYYDLTPTNVDPEHIKILHHGNCSSSRKLELMIEAFNYVKSNFHLYLMLRVSKSNSFYYAKLKKMASKNKNIHFLEPVTYDRLVTYSNNFDLGIQFHPPVNLNIKYGLGNKFFEFIQSRLGIIIGPSEEMVRYVRKYKLGIITKDFSPISLADSINNLSVKDIEFFKQQSHRYAYELSAEKDREKFLNIINKIL